MNARIHMRPRRRTVAVSVGVALVFAAGLASSKQAAQDHGYRTDGIVPSDKNECVGVPSCVSTTLPRVEWFGRSAIRVIEWPDSKL